MATPPTTMIGKTEVSRLLCGSNPFLGYSYRSAAHDAWQRRTMTPDRIAQILEKALEVGVTGMLGNFDDDNILATARQICAKRVGAAPAWIAYTHGGPPRQLETIDKLSDQGACAIYVQGGTVDSCFTYDFVGGLVVDGNDHFDDVLPWLQRIRERGCAAGLGSHRTAIIEIAEQRGYGAEFYTTPLNFTGTYCDYPAAARLVNTVRKPFIAIKTLGGRPRVSPEEGMTCAFTALKRTDCIAVGVENEESIEYDARLAADVLGWLDGKAM
jgi:hypothetical protein